MLWHIGNTTVRTPYRLRDALDALCGSGFNGNIIGPSQENGFAKLLHDAGVLSAPRIDEGKDAGDLGRKWRSALTQLGFLTPALSRNLDPGSVDPILENEIATHRLSNDDYSGRPYEVTASGMRLMESGGLSLQQQCFLRSLATYRIPSVLEKKYRNDSSGPFSPLLLTMQACVALGERNGGNPTLTFWEFALFVQVSTPSTVEDAVDKISAYRSTRSTGRSRMGGSVSAQQRRIARESGVMPNTLRDYADLSLRYLKSTGLFVTARRNGIAINPVQRRVFDHLLDRLDHQVDMGDYLPRLWEGAELPTDDSDLCRSVVLDISQQLRDLGAEAPDPAEEESLATLQQLHLQREEHLRNLKEERYASDQANRMDEIAAWIDMIPTGKARTLPDGTRLSCALGERPAYLEWVVWRAFLAIDSFENPPWQARRFQVDQDFRPVNCAPGGGADMIFEFEDFVLVVEVTLTASSRQEAAEGEPVRRHVASVSGEKEKPVFGLFIAVRIDSNTAHTFRAGEWYLADDSRTFLQIVPLALSDFRKIFTASGGFPGKDIPETLRTMMVECRSHANEDAPTWKSSISGIVDSQCAKMEKLAARKIEVE